MFLRPCPFYKYRPAASAWRIHYYNNSVGSYVISVTFSLHLIVFFFLLHVLFGSNARNST